MKMNAENFEKLLEKLHGDKDLNCELQAMELADFLINYAYGILTFHGISENSFETYKNLRRELKKNSSED